MLYVNMAAKTTTYSSSHPCPMSVCTMKIQGYHSAADVLVWCSIKMIAVQTIIYDVYLARTGNCNIGTGHECETVGLKQYSTECVWNGFIAWCNCKDSRE